MLNGDAFETFEPPNSFVIITIWTEIIVPVGRLNVILLTCVVDANVSTINGIRVNNTRTTVSTFCIGTKRRVVHFFYHRFCGSETKTLQRDRIQPVLTTGYSFRKATPRIIRLKRHPYSCILYARTCKHYRSYNVFNHRTFRHTFRVISI